MTSLASKQFFTIVVLAFIALLLNAAIPIYSIQVLKLANEDTLRARDHIEILDSILLSIVDAETGTRGYVITGDSKFLKPYYSAQERIESLIPKLEKSLTSFKDTYATAPELKKRIYYTLARLEETISTRQSAEPEAAYAMVKSGEGKKRMDAVRLSYNQLKLVESNKLEALKSRQSKVEINTNIAMIFLTLIDLILFALAFRFLLKSLRASKNVQENLNVLHNETLMNSQLLHKKNHIKSLQAKLNEVLQTVETQEEAFVAITNYGKHIFPQHSGAFYVKSNSKDYFERKSHWGIIQADGFEPHECWAVRSNNLYHYDEISKDMPCPHNLAIKHQHLAICLPSSTADEMLGILTLIDSSHHFLPNSKFDEEARGVAEEVVGHIGLAIANLRLREHLKKSAIVDSLTGLYNRRYLTETLGREIARAQRANQHLGIIMLDVDHFKMFNDLHGHEAGDLILKEVGDLLKQFCRTSDIACRYGGEEFVLVLPDADLSLVKKRAEEIRVAIKAIVLSYGGNALPNISISAGISAYPENATDAAELVRLADAALYQAKRNGRDQIQVIKKS